MQKPRLAGISGNSGDSSFNVCNDALGGNLFASGTEIFDLEVRLINFQKYVEKIHLLQLQPAHDYDDLHYNH